MTTEQIVDDLDRAVGSALRRPGDDEYDTATQPRNATADQHPVAVVAATSADDVRRAVRAAADAGLGVAVQATGHGAAGTVGDDVLLIDTRRMNGVSVDPSARTARVGAGATWAEVNAEAATHGLLGLAGTAPDVGVVGYTLSGGIGWLTRAHGMASASLRRVEFVDGDGEPQVADEQENPEALWAFRGAGGVGIVTAVEIDLVAVPDLWAGYRLWPITEAESVVAAWTDALGQIDETLTSAIGFLKAPDAPVVPEALRGHRVVHLSAASVSGEAGFEPLERALRAAPEPAIDTTGPCDEKRLAVIHLDPPDTVPAIGDGGWLTASTPAHALAILSALGVGDDAPLAEMEIRHVATTVAAHADGAMTSPPGPFLLHVVGPAPTVDDRRTVEQAIDVVRAAVQPVETGRAAASFRDGQTTVPGAFADDEEERLRSVRQRYDPHRRIRRPRSV
ncbi:FAD-binding oxidoreductase [Allobranchiibius huperziae]|uniref:FAD/FMN-containing dehydrogenase n=1 Tax=Allobranchiibius huperziae TaxID=1874116 RepID=A0A853D9T2_9MICO|nr:FAD-binding oxidoreductase [Allobranchiibius huperziae]NYJ73718.1 FAD/FMN-containing dehydrogenase [Allobranchiibius huperziae]